VATISIDLSSRSGLADEKYSTGTVQYKNKYLYSSVTVCLSLVVQVGHGTHHGIVRNSNHAPIEQSRAKSEFRITRRLCCPPRRQGLFMTGFFSPNKRSETSRDITTYRQTVQQTSRNTNEQDWDDLDVIGARCLLLPFHQHAPQAVPTTREEGCS
jgi:hypothetical protein